MKSTNEVESRVRAIVSQDMGIDVQNDSVDAEQPLEVMARIDSAALLQLLMSMEQEFGIEIDESEVTIDDLKNIKSITNLVTRNA